MTWKEIEEMYCEDFGCTSITFSPRIKKFINRFVKIDPPEQKIELTAKQIETAVNKYIQYVGSNNLYLALKELGFGDL